MGPAEITIFSDRRLSQAFRFQAKREAFSRVRHGQLLLLPVANYNPRAIWLGFSNDHRWLRDSISVTRI
jgi:hypothetical protein